MTARGPAGGVNAERPSCRFGFIPPEIDTQLDLLAARIAESPHNLVARGERATVRSRHVDECVAIGSALGAEPGQRWIDVGTGGGLPGLVLAILAPDVEWTLLDATRKKVEAVQAFVDELGLRNARPVAARAEALAHDPAYRERFDGAVSRALAPLPTVLELSRGFVRPGGVVAAVKGPRWADEVASSSAACTSLGLRLLHSTEVTSTDRPTWLVIMRALGPAPPAFPRREGRPRSHPLGGNRR